MCSVCGYHSCPSGCPNAGDPPTVYKCSICGENIVVGDEYVEFDGTQSHKDCFDGLDTDEMLKYIGGTLKIASRDDIVDGGDEAYECMRDERLS